MAYIQTEWEKGMVIDDSSLNNIEKGVHAALNIIKSLTDYEYNGNVPEADESLKSQLKILANGEINAKTNMSIGDSENLSEYETHLYTNTTNFGSFTVGTSSVAKDTILNGKLDVTGNTTIGKSSNETQPNFTALGDVILGSAPEINGKINRTNATINANTTIGGTLKVAEINDNNGHVIVNSSFQVGKEGALKLTTLHGGLHVNGNMRFGAEQDSNTAIFYANTNISPDALFTVEGNSVFGTGVTNTQNNTTTYSNTATFNANTVINGLLTTAGDLTTIEGILVTQRIMSKGDFDHITKTSTENNITLIQPTGQFIGKFKTIQLGSEASQQISDGQEQYDAINSSVITLAGKSTNINTKSTYITGTTTFGGTVILPSNTPTNELQAITKKYVDDKVSELTTTLNDKASLTTNNTFTGTITFNTTPNFIAPINLNNGFFLTTNNNPYFSLLAYQTKESFDDVGDTNYTYAGVLSYDPTNKQLVLGQANRTYQTDIYGSEINFHLSDNSGDMYTIPAPPATIEGNYDYTLKLRRTALINPETHELLPATNTLYWSEDVLELPPPEQDGQYILKLTRTTQNNMTANIMEWVAVPQGE